jgi:HEAT repeat protein
MKPALWVILAGLPLAAQPKQIVNAKTDTRSAAQGLEREFKSLLTTQPQPAWIGYSVPAPRSAGMSGCDYGRDTGVVHLEPPDHAIILFRVDGGVVNRLRTISPFCEIDAGNLPVHWLNDVPPAQSIALLTTFISDRERVGDSVVSAIAAHSDPAADQALEKFLGANQPQSLRLRAVSALGASRGRHGFDVLKKLIASDPDERIRERAISALASSREADTQDYLISIAKSDPNSRLRSQAVSALNRKPGQNQKVIDALVSIADNDADLQVKQRAVSTLQSMSDGQGIPSLIQIARNGRTPEVRKRAMQSLSQSRDPRALAFLEEMLKR